MKHKNIKKDLISQAKLLLLTWSLLEVHVRSPYSLVRTPTKELVGVLSMDSLLGVQGAQAPQMFEGEGPSHSPGRIAIHNAKNKLRSH